MSGWLPVLLLVALPQNSPRVKAELVPGQAHVGQAVILRVSVQTRGSASLNVELPALDPTLHVVGTQDFTESSFGPNGRITTTRREFVLMPQQPGTYTIPSLRVTLDRRVQHTDPLTLQVGAPGPADPDAGATTDDARVTVRMVPETVFVGQQSTLVGEVLLTPDLQMRLTRPPAYDAPAPADFWIQELQPDQTTEMRVIDGQRFIVQRFYRAYFPLSHGRFAFAPARVTYEARQGFLFAPQTRELRSASPRITVLPVPEEGRPRHFRGAVGSLSMSAQVEPRRGAVGDAVSLVVELSGQGNVKALPPPELPAIPGFDVLDPSESTELDAAADRLGGTKRFTWVLVPEREGTFALPAVEYASFDPEARTFRRHRVDPGVVTVAPAGSSAPAVLAGLRPQPEPNPIGWVRAPLFLAVQVVPIGLLVIGLVVRRSRSGPAARIKRGWDQRLAALQAARANPLTHAERLLRDALAEFVPSARVRSGSPAELHRDLQRLVAPEFADQVSQLLERLENARYAPGDVAQDERRSLLDQLGRVLDAAWQHARASARTQRAAIVPAALVLWQAVAPAPTFDEGLTAYRDKQFRTAAEQFEDYVARMPADPAGWYNLAVSYEADRRPARAAWAFLHALELRPRADDVEQHLNRLGARRLGQRVRPLLHINTEETFLIASGLWWLGALLILLAVLTRHRRLSRLALLPIALTGLVLATWAVERLLPTPALVLDQGAPLLAGQSLHADVVRHLQPLSTVIVLDDAGGWAHVRTATGERGWLSSDAIGQL
jgi:hypothetical protein